MLNYFHEHQAIPEVFVICSQLDTLKHRIMSGNYENPRKEFDECKDLFDAVKQKAIGSNNEQLANAQLIQGLRHSPKLPQRRKINIPLSRKLKSISISHSLQSSQITTRMKAALPS